MKAQDENKNGVVVGGVHFIVIVIIIYQKLNRKKNLSALLFVVSINGSLSSCYRCT